MRIGIYKDTFANNRGADIAVKNIAAGLTERGHEVTLFIKAEFDAQVRGDHDVIISAGTNEILDLAETEGLPPIVQQFHTDPRYPFRHWIKRWRRNRAIKAALKKVSAFQVLSLAHVNSLQKVLGISDPGRIRVVGNWSEYEESPVTMTKEKKVILCPGAINKDKNQSLLVDAFAELAAEFPDWRVCIYGRGKPTTEKSLLKRIASRGLEGRVAFRGYVDLAEPYAECAFVAFPSKTEGFPLTIIDAAMFGKPSLMIHDWIGCGETVDPEDFAAGLRKFMSDPGYRRSLGEKSRAYCLGHYAREKILDAWESVLRDAVSARRGNL